MRFLLALCFLLSCLVTKSQNYSTDDVQLINAVDKLFSENHVDYDSIISKVKARLPQQFLRTIDPESRYLTNRDAEEIVKTLGEFKLDQNYTRKQLEWLRTKLDESLSETRKILETIEDVDFFEVDSVFLVPKHNSTAFSLDAAELKTRWIKQFKYRLLLRNHGDSALVGKTQAEINSMLSNQLELEVESSICYLNQLLSSEYLTEFVLQSYIKAYCKSFDPHSDFLSKKEERLFLGDLSSHSYGTGIKISMDGNKLFVSEIIPFSSASYNEVIEVGDEITRLKTSDELISPACISDESINDFFFGDSRSKITIELKSNKDFQFRVIELSKSVINNSTNHTYSFLLENESTKVGYVQFPSFYTQFAADGRSAAEDLTLILLKLKKENVGGIIIDLRDNGGGSVKEASDLLGYFIDYGPLFTIEDQEIPDGRLIKDTKRGKVIDSKVIFLVNSFSASASELVAATMQKYPNSLIVGSPTFGKATGQILLPVKTKYARGYQGTVSITSMKIFRFDGTNYQGEGIIPDIVLPSLIGKSLVSEENYKHVLAHGAKRKFRQIKHRDEPIDSLRFLSKERNKLSAIGKVSKDLEVKLANNYGVSINYQNFNNPYSQIQSLPEETHESFEIVSMEEDEAFIEGSLRIKKYKEKDVILSEVFQIFEDWINLTKEN